MPPNSETMDLSIDEIGKARSAVLKRVPGEVPAIGKLGHEAKAFADSIKKKSVPELKDLLYRQEKILANSKLLVTLPDRGAKVRMKAEEIEKLLQKKTREINETAKLLENLQIDKESKPVNVDAMEWKFGTFGHLASKMAAASNRSRLDSDDDSEAGEGLNEVEDKIEAENPLKVLAEGSNPAKHKKSLSTKSRNLENVINDDEAEEKYDKAIVRKVDHTETKPKFVPYLSTEIKAKKKSSSSLNSKVSGNRSADRKKVELMPLPPESNRSVQSVTLEESLKLQKETAEKLRQAQFKQAMEKLARFNKDLKVNSEEDAKVLAEIAAREKTNYRLKNEDSDNDDDEEKAFEDEDGEVEKAVGISYTVRGEDGQGNAET